MVEKNFSGKSLDEAKTAAYDYFAEKGIESDSVRIEIIEQPVKKLFGTKGEYKIKASVGGANKSTDDLIDEIIHTSIKADKDAKTEASTGKEGLEKVIAYISSILNALGVDGYKIEICKKPELTVLDIVGDNLGIVIGRRGETLDSLQYLAVLANGRSNEQYERIAVDCNGYREKRKETLEVLAKRTATKVLKQGRRVTLEPMNPYERRIIHSTVSEMEGVYSNSIGEEPYRKVVISATVPKHRGGSGDRDRKGKRDNAPPVGRSYKQSSGFSTSFEREYKRNTEIEISKDTVDVEKSASLYGKIEL